MVDLVHLQQDLLHHVVPDHLEVGPPDQVGDVLLRPREEVVKADDLAQQEGREREHTCRGRKEDAVCTIHDAQLDAKMGGRGAVGCTEGGCSGAPEHGSGAVSEGQHLV